MVNDRKGRQAVCQAVYHLVCAGYRSASKGLSSSVDEGDSLSALVEAQLDAGAFSSFSSQRISSACFKTLESLVVSFGSDVFSWAFSPWDDLQLLHQDQDQGEMEEEDKGEEEMDRVKAMSPRERRIFFQVSLAIGLSNSEWFPAASLYSTLLNTSGSISYQMYRPPLVIQLADQLCKTKTSDKVSNRASKQLDDTRQVKVVLSSFVRALSDHDALRSRVEKTEAFEKVLETILKVGDILDEEYLELLKDVIGSLCFPQLSKTNKRDKQGEGEEDEIDDEDSLLELNDLEECGGMEQTDNQDRREATKAKVLRSVLAELKQSRDISTATEVLDALIRAEEERQDQGDSQSFSSTALRVLEHMCFQVPEKADARALRTDNLVAVLAKVQERLSLGTLYKFFQFLSKLSNSKDVGQRAFATHVAGTAVQFDKLDKELVQGIAELLLRRGDDKAPSVRIAAVKGMGNIVNGPFILSQSQVASMNLEEDGGASMPQDQQLSNLAVEMVRSCMKLLRNRMADPKPLVRRAAVKSMQEFLCSEFVRQVRGVDALIKQDFVRLCERCRDTSAVIRNSVLSNVHKFTSKEKDQRVLRIWADAALSLVYDSEASVQKNAQLSIKEIVFDSVVEWAKNATKSERRGEQVSRDSVWELLSSLSSKDVACLRKAFFDLARKDEKGTVSMAPKPVIKKVQFALEWGSSGRQTDSFAAQVFRGALVLLDMVVGGQSHSKATTAEESLVREGAISAVNLESILECWKVEFEEHDSSGAVSGTEDNQVRRLLLNVMLGLASNIPAAKATHIADVLFHLVMEMSMETELLRKCLLLLVGLCEAKAPNSAESVKMIRQWGDLLLESCEELLDGIHSHIKDGKEFTDEEKVSAVRGLFLCGELAVLGLDPDDKTKAYIPLSDKLITLTMGLLVSKENEENQENDKNSQNGQQQEYDDEEEGWSDTMKKQRQELRAHAFVATGKICLRDEKTAKRAMRMFVKELDQCAQSDIVRSNVIVILGDLCRRYTNMVDPYLDTISACLSDPSPVVRKHALILLTGLLQEDYIKWRGVLFVRYLLCAVDPDQEIQELVRFALKDIFPEKNAGLYHGQFVETIHALNGFVTPKYQVAASLVARENMSSLDLTRQAYVDRVVGSAELRMKLYVLLLEQMSDGHRLEVINKICKDVIGEILDGHILLPKSPNKVDQRPLDRLLADCFAVLCSPSIRVHSSHASSLTTEDEEVAASATAGVQAKLAEAKSKVLSKLERKVLGDSIIPLVISFYRMLQREKSPYVKHVSGYLRTLMKNFREEMDSVLGADKVLAQEIQYDLERFEKEEQRKREEEAAEEQRQRVSKSKRKSMCSAVKSSHKKRRVSGVTFQATEMDAAPRRSSGVLKTPIPVSSRKKARRSLCQEELAKLQAGSTPRLCKSERRGARSAVRPSARKVLQCTFSINGTPVSLSASKSSKRKWSIEPSASHQLDDVSRNLEDQLTSMES